ncbi:MAG: 1-deoxy-D-xylulose-5-phosphate reductoisomerase [bacterium]|nr:1-deoxy-D-xylulose-5-phosphate reductoisomerase [bacterium]
MTARAVSIWGSTGSIGTQAVDVILTHPDRFRVVTLTAHANGRLLLEQAKKLRPATAVLTGPAGDSDFWKRAFRENGTELLLGREGLLEAASRGAEQTVLNALVGSVGLEATLAAIRAGVSIALANKEVLVMAGDLVMREIRGRGLSIIPVDSEHSAVFQCLQGEDPASIRRILLTASGGPFLRTPASELTSVTPAQALAHPNWNMGRKVTIDSATLANKGLEVIEARWLFAVPPERIEVIVHPKSIIHSMVEFADGSVKAQLGVPDMRIPIGHALSHPERLAHDFGRLDFTRCGPLEFLPPDTERFPALKMAYQALAAGGTATAVYNAADEEAVGLFLSGSAGFTDIPRLLEAALNGVPNTADPDLAGILEADRRTRDFVRRLASKRESAS